MIQVQLLSMGPAERFHFNVGFLLEAVLLTRLKIGLQKIVLYKSVPFAVDLKVAVWLLAEPEYVFHSVD